MLLASFKSDGLITLFKTYSYFSSCSMKVSLLKPISIINVLLLFVDQGSKSKKTEKTTSRKNESWRKFISRSTLEKLTMENLLY